MIPSESPLAVEVTHAVQSGDIPALRRLLAAHPELPTERIGDERMSRTLLHAATDWPGHFPNGPAVLALLLAAGADLDARFDGPHRETALHWAASSDDVVMLDALLDAGADLDADGAVIGGGTALADAVAFGQWNAARRLVERGARVEVWQAAALGPLELVERLLASEPPGTFGQPEFDNALWCAAHGGQAEIAAHLIGLGADPAWIGHDGLTAARAAQRAGHDELADWLGR